MIGQIGPFSSDESPQVYLHGYVSCRLMNMASDSTLPICVCATSLDDSVLSLTPNSYNYNYRSVEIQGYGNIVKNSEGTLWAMQIKTDAVIPGRFEHTRFLPNGAEMQSTRILKVALKTASAKIRIGVPKDDKKDLRSEDILEIGWTGVVRVSQKLE
ncbi:hypothetical protein ACN47E_004311 [Coniothyrium glycines]